MVWKKPEHVAPGSVWRRFETAAARAAGGTATKYVIKDVSGTDETEACVHLMTDEFLPDEPLCHVLETTSDAVSVQTIQSNWRRFLSQGVGLACYEEDREGNLVELVAVNICIVHAKGDPDEDLDHVAGESWRRVLRTLAAAEATCDVFAHFGVDEYLSCSGMVVARAHRSRGLGVQLLQARESLCRALKLSATATVFTASASQSVATRCGWQTLGELPYSRMLQHGIRLDHCGTASAKLMGIQYQL